MKRSLLGTLLLVSCWACQVEHKPKLQPLSPLVIEAKTFGEPRLLSYQSCKEVEISLKQASIDYIRSEIARRAKDPPSTRPMPTAGWVDTIAGAPTREAAVPVSASSDPKEGVDFSGTNNQELGIDEADVVKIDGKYLYILSKSTLEIMAIPEVGGLEKTSTLNLERPGKNLLILGDTAIITTSESYPEHLRVDLVDLGADRKNPKLRESYYFEGEVMAARKIKDKIYIASYEQRTIPGLDLWPNVPPNYFESSEEQKKVIWAEAVNKTLIKNEEAINSFDFSTLIPTRLNKVNNKMEPVPLTEERCNKIYAAKNSSASGFLSLISIEPNSTGITSVNIEQIQGNRPIVYASNNQFILASNEHEPWWYFGNENLLDHTTIHRFDILEDGLTHYNNSVRIPGSLHNSFSLSEYEGYLRVATTTRPKNRFWFNEQNKEANHLFILGDNDGRFEVVSSLENLAPGEKIWSARFSKDKGFLVTFKQVDPLFTLDLKNPLEPKVAGMLKVPGVSTYLQDIGNEHLLAVGYGGDNEGLDWQTTVSLFDVSNFAKPTLANTLAFAIEEGLKNSSSKIASEANKDHLAINYFGPVAMTAIPLTASVLIENPLDLIGDYRYVPKYRHISKLSLIHTRVGDPLSIKGEIDHSRFVNLFDQRPPAIRRSYFYGDFVYAISSEAVTSTRLSDMKEMAAIKLP